MLAIDVSHFSQCVGGCHTWWYKKVDTRRKNTKWALVKRRKKCEDIKQEKLAKQRKEKVEMDSWWIKERRQG